MGPILIQLPPSLAFVRSRARSFFSLLRESFAGDVVCEPRHASWFTEEANVPLQQARIARVAADPACVPAAAAPGGDLGLVYYRLHGSPRRYYSSYSEAYLRHLAAQLKDTYATSRAWCIFDNTASGAAIQNALELRKYCYANIPR